MKKIIPTYRRVPRVQVHVVEIVTSPEHLRDVEDTLYRLREYSAAQVVDAFCISETYDEACKILDARALRDHRLP